MAGQPAGVHRVRQFVRSAGARSVSWTWARSVLQIEALRHDPECTSCGECAALLAIDLVAVIVVQDALPFWASRELETVQEHITRVVTTFARIVIARSIAPVVITVARV